MSRGLKEAFARLTGRPCVVNDVHSQLNGTRVERLVRPSTVDSLAETVAATRAAGGSLSIAAGRHAMGGQQFGTDTTLIDMNGLAKVLAIDENRGIATIQAGIQWPKLVGSLTKLSSQGWSIRQKQTGGDRLSLGGALASNIHTRGLRMKPIVEDVEAFTLVTPDGRIARCSRTENKELFALALGGYGMFGVIATIELRLARRHKLRRVVREIDVDDLMGVFDERIASGFEFGDFQFAIDAKGDEFLRKGIFACYEPIDDATSVPKGQLRLPRRTWDALAAMAHTDKARAYSLYRDFYLKTDGQVYMSDLHQMTPYSDGYHERLDRRTNAACKGSEMITEIYVPRSDLASFMKSAATLLRKEGSSVIYGTVRLIERDEETFLAWAREAWACVIFNLHVDHSVSGLEKAQREFRGLIDLGLVCGGSFYLTYHRWATRDQLLSAYPQLPEFIARKNHYDPAGLFVSDWWRHISVLCDRATTTYSPAAGSTSVAVR